MNHFKTFLLMASLSVLLVIVGDVLAGREGAVVALVLAAGMNFFSYWFSDKIILMIYRARQITHQEEPELYNLVNETARRAGLPMPRLYLIDSEAPNAFATGRNPEHAAVAVTTGIMNFLDRDELMGVIGHELSHIKHRDILLQTVAATMAGAISFIGSIARWGSFFSAGSDDDEGGGGNIFFVFLFSMVASLAAVLIQMAISRSREYMADEGSARIIGNPRYLARALKKLEAGARVLPMDANPSTAHLFIVNPLRGDGLMRLFSTHPPIEKRIERLLNLV